jgi:hypothetical protein
LTLKRAAQKYHLGKKNTISPSVTILPLRSYNNNSQRSHTHTGPTKPRTTHFSGSLLFLFEQARRNNKKKPSGTPQPNLFLLLLLSLFKKAEKKKRLGSSSLFDLGAKQRGCWRKTQEDLQSLKKEKNTGGERKRSLVFLFHTFKDAKKSSFTLLNETALLSIIPKN